MIVRCGSCRIELEVAGPGEFMCPACGTRNAVRGGAAPAPDLGLPDLGARTPATQSDQPPPDINWISCPSCAWRFACGDVDEVSCPTCGVRMSVTEDGAREINAG